MSTSGEQHEPRNEPRDLVPLRSPATTFLSRSVQLH